MNPAVWVPAATAAALSCATTRLVVPHLPEPRAGADDCWAKPRYADLASPRHLAASCLAGGLGGAVAGAHPGVGLPLLLALTGPSAALVLVDLSTTYLPQPLMRLCWLSAIACGAVGWWAGDGGAASLARVALAGALSAALFWLVWRAGAGIGFGDVRLAPLLGAGAATQGWDAWYLWLLLGSAIGAGWGVVTAVWRRRHAHPLGSVFPYGPALWLGLWGALIVD